MMLARGVLVGLAVRDLADDLVGAARLPHHRLQMAAHRDERARPLVALDEERRAARQLGPLDRGLDVAQHGLVERAEERRQDRDQLVSPHAPRDRGARRPRELRVVGRRDGRRPLAAREDLHLAARLDAADDHLAAVVARHAHVERAADDDVHGVARLAFAEEDRAGWEGRRLQLGREPRQLRMIAASRKKGAARQLSSAPSEIQVLIVFWSVAESAGPPWGICVPMKHGPEPCSLNIR
jgi:hypothetical protein